MADYPRARGVGESRRKVKLVTMSVEVSVCVEWPEGVPFIVTLRTIFDCFDCRLDSNQTDVTMMA